MPQGLTPSLAVSTPVSLFTPDPVTSSFAPPLASSFSPSLARSMRLSAPATPCFSTSAPAAVRLRPSGGPAAQRARRGQVGAPLALAGLLLGLAVLVAPERPADQEAICHRHNGVAACRVW
jgi:hypothetical protein